VTPNSTFSPLLHLSHVESALPSLRRSNRAWYVRTFWLSTWYTTTLGTPSTVHLSARYTREKGRRYSAPAGSVSCTTSSRSGSPARRYGSSGEDASGEAGESGASSGVDMVEPSFHLRGAQARGSVRGFGEREEGRRERDALHGEPGLVARVGLVRLLGLVDRDVDDLELVRVPPRKRADKVERLARAVPPSCAAQGGGESGQVERLRGDKRGRARTDPKKKRTTLASLNSRSRSTGLPYGSRRRNRRRSGSRCE